MMQCISIPEVSRKYMLGRSSASYMIAVYSMTVSRIVQIDECQFESELLIVGCCSQPGTLLHADAEPLAMGIGPNGK